MSADGDRALDGKGVRRLYEVPAGLAPAQRFEHWRHWYSQAVGTPVRLEATGPALPRFTASATSFSGPGFSVIDLHNGPASGTWDANPELNDLRLAYFVAAPSATYNFSGKPAPISEPRARFLDLSRGGAFFAPAGMHIIQLNLDRTNVGVDSADIRDLARVENLLSHPVLRSLVMPVLLNCRAAGIGGYAEAVAAVLNSAVTAMVSSILEVPAAPEALGAARLMAVKRYLFHNSATADLRAGSLADHFHVSRRTLFALFEGEELSLGERIRVLRTSRALELLLESKHRPHSTEAIAARSGFPNAQALNKALRELTGSNFRDFRDGRADIQGHLEDLRRQLRG